MWVLEHIEMKRLITHHHTKYSFTTGELSVIIGVNKDRRMNKKGSNSNGSGKSALFEGILLALTGEVCRKVGRDEFIMNGEDECEVTLKMKNNVLKKDMLITRTFYRTKSAKVKVHENGELVKRNISPNIANKYILDAIGISKEDLLNYYIVGQKNNKETFFASTDTKQKEIIGRISDYSKSIDELIDKLDKDLSDKEDKLNELHIEQEKSMVLIDSYKQDIEELEQDDDSEHVQSERDRLNGEIERYEGKIKTKLKESRVLSNEIVEKAKLLDKELVDSHNAKIDKKNAKLDKLRDKLLNVQDSVTDCKSRATELTVLLSGEIECPKCGEAFIPDSKKPLKQLKQEYNEVVSKEAELLMDEEQLKKDIKSLKNEIKSIEVELEEVEEAQDSVDEMKKDLKRLEKDIAYYKEKKKELKQELEEVRENKSNQRRIQDIKTKLKHEKSNLKSFSKREEKILRDMERTSSLIQHFGKKGFKTYLANMSIRHIQDVTNYYLDKFGTNLKVKINGWRLLKSGEIRDTIEVFIIEDGINRGSYHKYSGGEANRVDLCSIIGLNSLINNGCEYGKGLDLLCIDENVAYLDGSGQYDALEILSKINTTTMIIMHNIENIPVKNRVFCVKENKVTTVHTKKPKGFDKAA